MTAVPQTLILTRRDLASLMAPADYRVAVEAAFRALAEGLGETPGPMQIIGPDGGFHVKGAAFPAGVLGPRSYAAFKVNGNFPGNRAAHGLPTIQGAIVLSDAATGAVLALMDSIEITLRRTAAATAVAAARLARPDSRRITVCGCGDQAIAQLAALKDVLPLEEGAVWDIDPARAAAFANAAEGHGVMLAIETDLAAATAGADVILTCTTARAPFLAPRHVAPGTFIAAVGADNPEKSEISADLMASAKVVPDVLAQAAAMGDLHHAIAAGAMNSAGVHAELGQIVAGKSPGRTTPHEITLFDSTGTAIQDVAAAAAVYEIAMARGLGRAVTLG
jgi:ornithine cyclodeaminase/alanine dehydrogenase-like protein (mu-crystallin family)